MVKSIMLTCFAYCFFDVRVIRYSYSQSVAKLNHASFQIFITNSILCQHKHHYSLQVYACSTMHRFKLSYKISQVNKYITVHCKFMNVALAIGVTTKGLGWLRAKPSVSPHPHPPRLGQQWSLKFDALVRLPGGGGLTLKISFQNIYITRDMTYIQ